jgi:hypothetical protein
MNRSGWLVIPIAVILAALPAFAGICDLRCASSQSPMHLAATVAAVGEDSPAGRQATCPFHAAGEAGSRPAESPSGPCHGPRDGRAGVILVASASTRASIAPAPYPVFEAFALAPWSPERTAAISRDDSAFDRSPGSSPRRSVLRI